MIMIGVSTGQNITNLIPAVQSGMKVHKFILLETSTAIAKKWSQGFSEVLEKRNTKIERISLEGIDSHISKIQKKLTDRFLTIQEPLIWNLGGGQKPQQIPIWELFKLRNEKMHMPDILCYANQDDKGLLEIWEYKSGKLSTRSEKISVDLSVHEIFNAFGYGLKEVPQKIYDKNGIVNFQLTPDLFTYQEFRQFLFKVASFYSQKREESYTIDNIMDVVRINFTEFEDAIQAVIETSNFIDQSRAIRSKILGNKKRLGLLQCKLRQISETFRFKIHDKALKNELESILSGSVEFMPNDIVSRLGLKKNSTGDYFEKILIDRVKHKLETTIGHNITEAYANLITEKDGQVVAEYDILCVTDKGTIIALDAKTFSFEKKDIDARLYNLEQGSGFYRSFSAIFPYNTNDFEEKWFEPIKNLPFDLTKRRLPFFVVNDGNNSDFWVRYEEGGMVCTYEKPESDQVGWLRCRSWENFLNQR